MVSQNVAGGITVKTDDRHNPKQKAEAGVNFPTKPQIKLLIDNAPPLWRPYILTAAFTGLRASELRGLCWADVDLEGGELRVRQRADKWCKMGRPKSRAGTRKVLLTPMVINTLRQWRRIGVPEPLRKHQQPRKLFIAGVESAPAPVWTAALHVPQFETCRCFAVYRNAWVAAKANSGNGRTFQH
jgi:integrase